MHESTNSGREIIHEFLRERRSKLLSIRLSLPSSTLNSLSTERRNYSDVNLIDESK